MTVKQVVSKLLEMPQEKELYIQTGGDPMYFKAYSVKEKELVDCDTMSDEEIDVVVIKFE